MAAEAEDDAVVAWYREHVGEPDRRVDIYLGFGLFFAGLGFGVGGLLLFLGEQVFVEGTGFWLREVAFAVGAFGLPALLLGVVVLLPVDRRALYVGGAGLAVTLVAIALFVTAYPGDWNVKGGPDMTAEGVTTYAVGLVSLVAAAGAALVSYHVERSEGGPAADADGDGAAGPQVTDEEVRRDIDEATAATDITWGGVPKTREQRLSFTAESDDGIQSTNIRDLEAKTVRASGSSVEDAVLGLQQMKGDVDRTDRGSSTDDATSALADLKRRQAEAAAAEPDGLLDRIRRWLGR